MKTLQGFLFILICSACLSCGAELDAKEVCKCYREVYALDDEAGTEKMKECMNLLDSYIKKHKENNTYESFITEYDKCR